MPAWEAGVEPYWSYETRVLYMGDALAVLASLPSSSVDAVITDPPYSSGGMVRGDRVQAVHTKYVKSDSISGAALPDFSGDNRDQRAYGYWCALWLGECLRVTRPGGACLLFTDWRQLPTTVDALQAGGWVWRGIVPWHKPNGRPTLGRFANSCEYVAWGTSGPRPLEHLGGCALPGFFQAHPPREREHITQKPVGVMRELVRIAPKGGRILDPFMGSGTTGVAAVLEGYAFTGIDLDPVYVQTSRERIQASVVGYRDNGSQLPLPGAVG
jgi:site-specific DNA-methyltransferase (adenine-specific)